MLDDGLKFADYVKTSFLMTGYVFLQCLSNLMKSDRFFLFFEGVFLLPTMFRVVLE